MLNWIGLRNVKDNLFCANLGDMYSSISFSFADKPEPLTGNTRNLALKGSNFDFRCVHDDLLSKI